MLHKQKRIVYFLEALCLLIGQFEFPANSAAQVSLDENEEGK